MQICRCVNSVSVGIRGIYDNHKSRFVIALLAILEFSIIQTQMYVTAIK